MREIKLACAALFVLVAMTGIANAQGTQVQNEPEFIGVFMGLRPDGSLMPLERHKTQVRTKIKAFGFGGASGALEVAGEKSSVRFKAGDDIQFVVRAPSQQTDPVTLIQFYRFETKKGKRQMIIMEVGGIAFKTKDKTLDSTVPFDVTKHGQSSFRIAVSSTLPPGEYFFGVVSDQNPTTDAFCFGVDP